MAIRGKGQDKSAREWVGKVRGSAREARELFATDQKQREAADRGPSSVILDPKHLDGSPWEAGKVLETTLGGVKRPINGNDLAAFRQNIRTLGTRFKGGGITARKVIDLSRSIDLERAREQIHHAIPAGFNRGELRLITNAGPDSVDTRHHIVVKFPLFDLAVNDANRTPEQAALWLTKQPLRYDCDCGRHRFWYRYIATIGGFNAGRAEHGYPKIRNPDLYGIGCKHAIRAMSEIDSSASIRSLLTRAIKMMRDKDAVKKNIQASQAEADKAADRSAREIRTSENIASRQAKAREMSAARTAARTAAQASPPRRRGFLSRAKEVVLGLASKLGLARDAALKIINSFRGR